MATKTFLQLVNHVLLELRETQVTTWNQSDYSTLIGTYVNSAMRMVQNAWKWSQLYDTKTITTVAATQSYALTGTNERAQIESVWNSSTYGEMTYRTRNWFTAQANNPGGQLTGSPTDWTGDGQNSSGETKIKVYPVPTAVETLSVYGWFPQSDLTLDLDVCDVPWRPVVDTALALARGERGEDGGISQSEAGAFAAKAAGDSIALDAQKNDEMLVWTPY